jgi:hypothetical protein
MGHIILEHESFMLGGLVAFQLETKEISANLFLPMLQDADEFRMNGHAA